MLTYQQMMAEVAQHLAEDDSHGYSQPNRAGDGGVETVILSDGTAVRVHTGDYDCSELVRTCAAAAGLLDWDYWSSYLWTGNQDEVLRAAGFERLAYTPYDLEVGDVLWKTGHTGVYVGGGRMVDAHGDEYGGITGPTKGDQTGREIEERSVLACSWQRTYRYAGPARGGSSVPPEQTHTVPGEEDPMQPRKFVFNVYTVVRDAPSKSANIVTDADGTQVAYDKGESVTVDSLSYADGVVWGGYTGGSGARRYVAVGYTTRVQEA